MIADVPALTGADQLTRRLPPNPDTVGASGVPGGRRPASTWCRGSPPDGSPLKVRLASRVPSALLMVVAEAGGIAIRAPPISVTSTPSASTGVAVVTSNEKRRRSSSHHGVKKAVSFPLPTRRRTRGLSAAAAGAAGVTCTASLNVTSTTMRSSRA